MNEIIEYKLPTPNLFTETKFELAESDFQIPTIYLAHKCWIKIFNIIKAAGEYEVGFLGSVERPDSNSYLITDVYLFKQTVSAIECDFDTKDLGAFYKEILSQKDGKNIVNKLLFWGHLHPHNNTEPSTQDDEQMDLFNHNDFFIRGIFTQTGETKFDVYNYKRGIKMLDCPWTLYVEENKEEFKQIKKEVKKKSKKKNIVFNNSGPFHYGGYTGYNQFAYLNEKGAVQDIDDISYGDISHENNGKYRFAYEKDI